MPECPSPRGRLHNRLGPEGGHDAASPFPSAVKLRRGPPQPGHSGSALPGIVARPAEPAKTQVHRNRTLSIFIAQTFHEMTDKLRVRMTGNCPHAENTTPVLHEHFIRTRQSGQCGRSALKWRLWDGALFLSYFVLLSVLRFLLFFVRGNVPVVALGLKNAQRTALAILAASLPALVVLFGKDRRIHS